RRVVGEVDLERLRRAGPRALERVALLGRAVERQHHLERGGVGRRAEKRELEEQRRRFAGRAAATGGDGEREREPLHGFHATEPSDGAGGPPLDSPTPSPTPAATTTTPTAVHSHH